MKFQKVTRSPTGSGDLLSVTVRYRDAAGGEARSLEISAADAGGAFESASADLRTAAAAAAFGMLLRHSPHAGSATFEQVIDVANSAAGEAGNDRRELAGLAAKAKELSRSQPASAPSSRRAK